MSVLVVITSYKVPDLTIDCLNSLAEEKKLVPELQVGICDNGNTDNTYQRLVDHIAENSWEEWVYIRRVSPNRGFSGGNNVILREALQDNNCPEYFLLLNADTLVRPGAIQSLLHAAEQNPQAGIFGPQIGDMSDHSRVTSFRYISPVSEMIHSARTGLVTSLLKKWEISNERRSVPKNKRWLSFACALIRKEVMNQVGVLDEGYYLYYDDVDYCRTTGNAGWEMKSVPEAVVAHIVGQSTKIQEDEAKLQRRPNYWYVSRSWYFTKFYGKLGLLGANLFWLLGRSISFLRELVGNKKPHLCKHEIFDIWIGFFDKVTPRNSVNN